jgi:hypothetical protein
METAFIIGNGESRNMFPIDTLKGQGVVYGCNAIYRDHPELCDHIVAVNAPMYDELKQWHDSVDTNAKIHGIDDISRWNYICDGDHEDDRPEGLHFYRIWRGYDSKKNNAIKTNDFSKARGSGCSAVLMAAESGISNVVILAFDILGAKQWEHAAVGGGQSREQNNIYKNTNNYPKRLSMKAYLKFEWMYQLRQIFRRFPDTNFHFINRREYLECNTFLRKYFDQPNIKCGIYADLQRWITGERDLIRWTKL